MQLKPASARRRLIAASATLLGATAARSQELSNTNGSGGETDWVTDSALAYYQEENGRIQVIEPVIDVRKDYGDGHALSFNLTYDSLSGSTPNGALPSNQPQTFASPSGTSLSGEPQTYTTASGQVTTVSSPIYMVNPGELPMDPNFRDQRIALGGTWQWPLARLTRVTVGSDVSWEHDFTSFSANAAIAQDFNERNTTLSLALNGEFDSLSPIGGAPEPGSDYALFQKTGGKTKNGGGVMLGLTQVMNRRWLAQLNLSMDRFSGYLNDPYKIISVIDDNGLTTAYLYEKRPDSRTRGSAYLENRVAWDRATATLSFRYMTDDWGVRSQTAQIGLHWSNPDRDRYLEPSIRWYRQTAADFYTPWISDLSAQQLDSGSADERLGPFHALTFSLKYAQKQIDVFGAGPSELSLRAGYYQQIVDDHFSVPPALGGLDLYPGLKAVFFQVGWRFGF